MYENEANQAFTLYSYCFMCTKSHKSLNKPLGPTIYGFDYYSLLYTLCAAYSIIPLNNKEFTLYTGILATWIW